MILVRPFLGLERLQGTLRTYYLIMKKECGCLLNLIESLDIYYAM